MLHHYRYWSFTFEWKLAGKHLVEDDAQRVEIALGLRLRAVGLLGRDVVGSAHDGALHRQRGERCCPRDPKVRNLHLPRLGEQDIRRLHIAVDYSASVSRLQSLGDL